MSKKLVLYYFQPLTAGIMFYLAISVLKIIKKSIHIIFILDLYIL